MADIKMSLPTPRAEVEQQVSILLSTERIPSNWTIRPADEDNITATHLTTGKLYEGSIQGFNEMLKGK